MTTNTVKKVPLLPPKPPKHLYSPTRNGAMGVTSVYNSALAKTHHPRARDSVASTSSSVSSYWSSTLSVYENDPNQNGLDHPHSPYLSTISPGTLESMELVFSFSDSDIVDKLSQSWPVKCTYIVKELIVTERAYVQSLADVIKGYLTPLYSHVLETGESPNFIRTVFGNIVKIHQIHTDVLDAMQSSSTSPEEFARVFLNCDFLTQYTIYCTNYTKGNDCLEHRLSEESSVKDFIAQCQRDLSHSLPLSSELIKPVQRILKYPLLLDDLNKKFDWLDHPGYRLIKEALEKMSSVALRINTAFHDPVKAAKKNPRLTAQKRTRELNDLQKSRSLDARRSSPNSPGKSSHAPLSHTHSLPHTYRSKLFPLPASQFSSVKRHANGTAAHWDPPMEEGGATAVRKSFHESMDVDQGVKPRVNALKNFFEKLTEQSETEMLQMSPQRRQSKAGLTRATSLTEDSFVIISPNKLTRAPSLGNMDTVKRTRKRLPQTENNPPEKRSILRRFGRSKKATK